jgi:hypothetical protein
MARDHCVMKVSFPLKKRRHAGGRIEYVGRAELGMATDRVEQLPGRQQRGYR